MKRTTRRIVVRQPQGRRRRSNYLAILTRVRLLFTIGTRRVESKKKKKIGRDRWV